jgi:hypothetical protein
MFFDYWIASKFVEPYQVFSYLGEKGKPENKFDENEIWIWLKPWGRFMLKLIVFATSIFYYIQ